MHLLRNSFRYASRRDWAAIAKDLKPVYPAATEAEALDRFADFSGIWEARYPAIIKLWENAGRCGPLFRPSTGRGACRDHHHERDRVAERPVPPLGQGPRPYSPPSRPPSSTSATPAYHLNLDPTGRGRQRWSNRGKPL